MVYREWEQSVGGRVVATTPFSEKVFDFIPKGGRVLDLGCGNGRISKIIKEHGYDTYGTDVNAEAIAFAQSDANLANIKFSVQDATATNYVDKSFDAVIEQAVLACMEKSDRSVVLAEVYRILKPGGIFSITEFDIEENLKKRYDSDALVSGEYGTVIVNGNEEGSKPLRSHHFNREELEALIKNAGFEVVQSMHPNFITRSGNEHPGHQYISRKV